MMVPQHDYGLTSREQEILELMTKGLIKKEIADKLSVSIDQCAAGVAGIDGSIGLDEPAGFTGIV